ncbi:hypothetical protein [Sphingomonas phage Carli]|nr:hypothetical protein [Sphingomonas phage Carli]
MLIALILISTAALAYAVRIALSMVQDRAATCARIARAVRPQHGASIRYVEPMRSHDRPGDN